jgi:N-acetylmuramoyl-L-alanine amidase
MVRPNSLIRHSALWAALLLALAGADRSVAAARTHHAHAAPTRAARAQLQGAALQSDAGFAELTLRLSATVPPKVYQLGSPARVVIDLPATVGAASLHMPAASGLIAGLRAAPHAGLYRVVLELREPLRAAPALVVSGSGAGYQLRLRLSSADVSPVQSAAAPSSSGPSAHTVRPEHMPGSREIVVAIDAGHGGDDPGASGRGGTHEKDVVLAIARALAARLNERPGMRAVLTRDADRLIDLRERMERARSAHADLFVSIHADAVRDRSIAGASVYTLSYRGASSEAAKRLADHENALVLKGGTSLAGVDPALASVLLDVSQEANMGASVEAADEVLVALDRVGAVRKKVVQHAAFVVLKSPDLPSMLVETAYISNPEEERKLRSPGYQSQLAAAIEAGVVAYFRSHPPDGTEYTARLR